MPTDGSSEDVTGDRIVAGAIDLFVVAGIVLVASLIFLLVSSVANQLIFTLLPTHPDPSPATGEDMSEFGSFVAIMGATMLLSAVLAFLKWLVISVAALAYYAGMQAVYGQTPGQRVIGLQIVDQDGRSITRGQALGRAAVLLVPLVLIVPAAPLFTIVPLVGIVFDPLAIVALGCWGGVEALVASTDDQHRRLGDRLVDTRVVRE